MRLAGWIGMAHVGVIIGWLIVSAIFFAIFPLDEFVDTTLSDAEIGIAYWAEHRGLLGLDHGSKSLVLLLCPIIPVVLFHILKKIKAYQLYNVIALVAGILSFFILSVSLMLQATAVEYAFKLYEQTENAHSQHFAVHLYEWVMLEGGLSVSIYIIANLLLSVWVSIHSYGLMTFYGYNKLAILGFAYASLQVTTVFFTWYFLMRGLQIMHQVNNVIEILFHIWMFALSLQLIRQKFTLKSVAPTPAK